MTRSPSQSGWLRSGVFAALTALAALLLTFTPVEAQNPWDQPPGQDDNGQPGNPGDPSDGLVGGDNPFGDNNQLGTQPKPQVGVSDLLDEDGNFTWNDGKREFTLQLLDSLTSDEQAELAELGAPASLAYPSDSSGLDNGTLGGEPARGNWFRSDTGQLYQLVGGVNVFFTEGASRTAIDAVFLQHNVDTASVAPLGELPNAFFVTTNDDVATLKLVKALEGETLVDAVEPNTFTRHSIHEQPEVTAQSRSKGTDTRCTRYTAWLSDKYSSCLWHLDSSTDFRYAHWRGNGTDPKIDINISDVWKTTMGAGITVAVVDTKWNPNNEDLVDNVNETKSTKWAGQTNEHLTFAEYGWHATAIAGVIGARDNKLGGRGVAPRVTLVNYNYLDHQSSYMRYQSFTKDAKDIAVSNHSYGISANGAVRTSSLWDRAMEYGLRYGFNGKGTSYVVSAGNGNSTKAKIKFPSDGWSSLEETNNHIGIIAVCAASAYGNVAIYSEHGPNLWVCAPSSSGWYDARILAPMGDNYYNDQIGGTSAAAGQVSGVVALMRAVNKNLTWRDVKLILANTAQKVRPDDAANGWETGATKYGPTTEKYHYSHKLGFGLVDAKSAVTAAANWQLLPAFKSTTVAPTGTFRYLNPGQSVEYSVTVKSEIDFVEFVDLPISMSVSDIRKLRVTLVSPSGATSLLAKEDLECPKACSLYGGFTFGSARHVGEDPNGTWKLKVENLDTPPPAACSNPNFTQDQLSDYDCSPPVRARFWSFAIRVYGHVTPAGSTAPKVSISGGADITEGGTASFTVTATPAPKTPLSVKVALTQQGSFASVTSPRTVTVPTSGSAQLAIPTVNDDGDEPNGSIVATLMADNTYVVSSPATATVRIADDDEPTPVVKILDRGGDVVEGANFGFRIQVTPPQTKPLQVALQVFETGDFLTHGQFDSNDLMYVTINPTSYLGIKPIALSSVNDRVNEADGTVRIAVSPLTEYEVGSPKEITFRMIDNDAGNPLVSVTAGSGVTEGGTATFTLTASPPPPSSLTVNLTVGQSGHFAASGTTGAKTVTIPTSGTATYTVATEDDNFDEADGSITLTVSSGQGYEIGSPATNTVTVADNDVTSVSLQSCSTNDISFVTEVDAKVARHSNSGRTDLHQMFGSVAATMKGQGTYTVDELRARPDKQSANWNRPGPNALWQRIYTELDRLEACRDAQTPQPQPASVPTVSIAGGSAITEGSTATFTVTATPAPTSSISARVAINDSGDFATSGQTGTRTVTITSSGSATLSVTTVNDSTDEANGTISATLQTSTGYSVGTPSSASVGVADNDAPPVIRPTITIAGGSSVTEGGTATFTVTASPVPTTSLTVTVSVSDSGNFVSSGQAGTRTVTITSSGSATLTVTTVNDSSDEPDGAISATLQTSSDYSVGTPRSASISVSDNDPPPAIRPTITIAGGSSVTEGGTVTFTLNATPAPTSSVAVRVTVSDSGDFATSGQTGTRTVTITSSGSATLSVTTVNDSTDEANGTISATLQTSTGYNVGTPSSASVSVSDDDVPAVVEPTISITAGPSITEGQSATFTVTASPRPTSPLVVTVNVIQNGNYALFGQTGNRRVIVPTSGTATLSVRTVNDLTDEPHGSIVASLQNGSGYRLGSPSAARLAVADNDAAQTNSGEIAVTASEPTVKAGGALEFVISLSRAPHDLVMIVFYTQDGSAKKGTDYVRNVGPLRFKSGGPLQQTVSVETLAAGSGKQMQLQLHVQPSRDTTSQLIYVTGTIE